MLLPDNIHPENSIYYNGAIVLKTVQEYGKIDMIKLFHEVNKIKSISFPVYILSLDWLYLINAAINKKGKVHICS